VNAQYYDALFAGLMSLIGMWVGWLFRANIAINDLREKQKENDKLRAQKAEVEQELMNARQINAFYRKEYR